MSKSAEDAIAIIENMELSDHQCQYNRGPSKIKVGIIELGTNDAILSLKVLLTQTVEELTNQLSKFL